MAYLDSLPGEKSSRIASRNGSELECLEGERFDKNFDRLQITISNIDSEQHQKYMYVHTIIIEGVWCP